MHIKLNNQRGDTLVEVTLAVAILAIVLASAYTVTSRAAKVGQSAKERSQAVALVQQQAEIIESFAIRDWDGFVADFKPNSSGTGHYMPSSWVSKSNKLINPLGAPTDADFEVYYQAKCSISKSDLPKSCTSIIDSSDIKRINFIIKADWIPIGRGDTNDRDSTTIVVQVSPSGIK